MTLKKIPKIKNYLMVQARYTIRQKKLYVIQYKQDTLKIKSTMQYSITRYTKDKSYTILYSIRQSTKDKSYIVSIIRKVTRTNTGGKRRNKQ